MATAAAQKKAQGFHDQLARLTHFQACQILGDDGESLIRSGTANLPIELDEQAVYLGMDLFRVRVLDGTVPQGAATAVLKRSAGRKKSLEITCDQCEVPCEHMGAALGLLLDEKAMLGLAAPPDEAVPMELLTREELTARALAERSARADAERMTLRSLDSRTPWTDYVLTSHQSGRTYRVCLLGQEPGDVFCSCPDFRTNRLGTCKHIIYALERVRQRFSKKALATPYQHQQVALFLDYQDPLGLKFNGPESLDAPSQKVIDAFGSNGRDSAPSAMKALRELRSHGHDVLVYPDAESWIDRELAQQRLRALADEIRQDPANHRLRHELLSVTLHPYQLDGIAFAVGAGRCVLADDMGLGKTIQGIGVAELLAQTVGISRVLVLCPASLKSQWQEEIRRFSGRSSQLVLGNAEERARQYESDAFFTICNYEQTLRDTSAIERIDWDLIILDEGQRIKNWESKTSQIVRSLKSRFSLVLSGTPLENRIDDLYTVVKFVDDQRLGPAYEFFHRHRIVSETGRVQGVRNLDDLRERLKPILLRRTRAEVLEQLPERTTTVVRIQPTAEQLDLHTGFMHIIAQVTRKPFLTEMDLLRLQKALLMARLSANSTVLVDKEEPGYSTKLDRLAELFEDLFAQDDRKAILFSEWRRMLDLIEPLLDQLGVSYVRLDGQVPQKKRARIVESFQQDPETRVILMTNAGSTGLNLQAANTVINVDLPWNPAILEQRIARAHRMGQKNPVNVYLLITEQTIEERLLDTLATKQDLALAALDSESKINEVQLESGMEELRRRLEQLLGQKPDAPLDASQAKTVEAEAERIARHRDRVASAGGELMGAAFRMVGELVAQGNPAEPDPAVASSLRQSLVESVERDEQGRPQLRFTFPNDEAISQLAETLARLTIPATPAPSGSTVSTSASS